MTQYKAMDKFKNNWREKSLNMADIATAPPGLSMDELRMRGFVRCKICGDAVDFSSRPYHLSNKHNGRTGAVNDYFTKGVVGKYEVRYEARFQDDSPQAKGISGRMVVAAGSEFEAVKIAENDFMKNHGSGWVFSAQGTTLIEDQTFKSSSESYMYYDPDWSSWAVSRLDPDTQIRHLTDFPDYDQAQSYWNSLRSGVPFYPTLSSGKEIATKSEVIQKPGVSIHTPKWDECVAQVKAKGGADPYAVCTAQLGEESFKSEYRGLAYTKSVVKNAKRYLKMNVAGAGPVPNSLLAGQDLEPEKDKMDKGQLDAEVVLFEDPNFKICHYLADDSFVVTDKRKGDEYKLYSANDAVERLKVLQEPLLKSVATNDALVDLKEKAEDADTSAEKNDIVSTIKAVQLRRQKATLAMRAKEEGKMSKSFADFWKHK